VYFPLPILTAITDDLQEWGRPIGDFSEALVSQCQVAIDKSTITLEYVANVKHSTIGSTPFSFLEHTFAKVRNLSQLKYDEGNNFKCNCNVKPMEPLKLTNSSMDTGNLAFNDSVYSLWPNKPKKQKIPGFSFENDLIFLTIKHPKEIDGKTKIAISDFIVLGVPSHLQTKIPAEEDTGYLESIVIEDNSININTSTVIIKGEIEAYYYTDLDQSQTRLKTTDMAMIDFEKSVGILKVMLTEIHSVGSTIKVSIENKKNLHIK
jgi:hypothetical protein